MPVRVDFSQTDEKSFAAIPAGVYEVQVISAEWKEPKSGGDVYLNVQLSVTDKSYANRRIFSRLTSTPAKNWSLLQFLKAVGYTDEEVRNPSFELDEAQLVGATLAAQVTVKPKTDDYDESNEVKKFMAI